MKSESKTSTLSQERQKAIRKRLAVIDRESGERDGNLIKSAILLESAIGVAESKKDFLEKELVKVSSQILASKAKLAKVNESILNSTCSETTELSLEYERNEALLGGSKSTPS